MKAHTRHRALDSWGDYDRDDPFPLFAQVRSAGPVHEVTLADGHPAWLVVGHEEARAALNDSRLSKDMHAALARSGQVVAEGLPGPALARHMLVVDPPDHTRLRRLAMPAFGRRRVNALETRVRSIVEDLLTDLAARGGTDRVVDLVAGYAFPLPFTVISELLGIPEPDRADLGTWFGTLLTPYRGAAAPGRGGGGVGGHRRVPHRAARPQARRARRGPGYRPRGRRRHRRRAHRTGDALDDLPAGRRRARHDHQPDRQRHDRAAAAPRAARRAGGRPRPRATHHRGVPALGRPSAALDLPLHHRTRSRSATSSSPRSPKSSSRSRRQTGTPPATATQSRSTSTGSTAPTSPSATASTSASARRWPGCRHASPLPRCTPGSPRCASASRPPNSTGDTATGSCYEGSPSYPWSSDHRRRPRRRRPYGHKPDGLLCRVWAVLQTKNGIWLRALDLTCACRLLRKGLGRR